MPPDLLLILGGLEPHMDEMRATDTCLAFEPSLSRACGAEADYVDCKPLPSLPRLLSQVAATYHEPGDCVYLVGGRLFDGTPSNDIFCFNMAIVGFLPFC